MAKPIDIIEDQKYKPGQGYDKWLHDIKEVDRNLSYFLVKPTSIVCDVGACLGIDVLEFAERGAFVIDIDIDRNVLKYAKMQARKSIQDLRLNLVVASATDLPFRDKTLDLVTCFSVLDHLPNKHSAYRAVHEFSRVVCEYGHVAVTAPNKLFLIGTVSMKLKSLVQPDAFFEQRFTPSELMRILTASGLTPIIFESKYPTSVGRGILDQHFPRAVKSIPCIMALLSIGARILSLAPSSLRLFGARMGYLSQKR